MTRENGLQKSRGIIVLGMHRSGTSTVTGVLGKCGAWLGDEEQFLPAKEDNPKGFFERQDLNSICNSLLASVHAAWWRIADYDVRRIPEKVAEDQGSRFLRLTREISENGTWAIKDPRLCLVFPVLKKFVPEAVCVLPIRNPVEVARSLRTRNDFSILQGIALWEAYTRAALAVSEDRQRVIISYDDLISHPQDTAESLVAALQGFGVDGLSVSKERIWSFVSPDLKREKADDADLRDLLTAEQADLWNRVVESRDLAVEGKRPISRRTRLVLSDLEYQHGKRLDVERRLRVIGNEIDIMQKEVADARGSSRTTLKQELQSRMLYALASERMPFSERRRAKFLRSAQKRDATNTALAGIARLRSLLSQQFQNVGSSLPAAKAASPAGEASGASSDARSDGKPVRDLAVVVPVYNAADDLEQCIARLLAHTPPEVTLLFIDDASPDPRIAVILDAVADGDTIRVLRNATNKGFTRTVNIGLAATSPMDVIILNSDARVTPGWTSGLLAAARSRPKVATVTAMSDRAGAFSAPEIGNENTLPPGVSEITYARAFRRKGLGLYPSVPTGNGFCMFISRDCMEEIGGLDEEAFPRGYGEENDFCMRAVRAGWANLIDDCTYVFHSRSKSFGDEKNDLMIAGRSIIDERYPEYRKAIAVYSKSPEMISARSQAKAALEDCASPNASNTRILFVISTQTGGTPQTNGDLMSSLGSDFTCFVLRCDGSLLELWERKGDDQQLLREHSLQEPVDPVSHLSAEYNAVVDRWMSSLDLDLVHIRHLAWHSISLPEIARRHGRAVVMSFHDFYTLCPTVKLLDDTNSFCDGVCSASQDDCSVELWPKHSMPRLKGSWVHVWRQRFGNALSNCDAYVTTSESARSRILRHLPELDASRFSIIPHGRDFAELLSVRAQPDAKGPIRVLVPGNLSEAKGLGIIRDVLAADTEGALEFHVLGKLTPHFKHKRLINHGSYQRDEFAKKAAAVRPHFGAVFSIWDETWCHTLTEMWSVGLPVAVLDFPTVAGRMREASAGWVLDASDIPALRDQLYRFGRDRAESDRAECAVRAWQNGPALANNNRRMAADYVDIYRNALKHRYRRQTVRPPSTTRDDTIGSKEREPGHVRPARVAVVGPSNATLTQANGSTEVRLWERTHNGLGRNVTFVRLNPEELLASVVEKTIDVALVQRNVIPQDLADALLSAMESADLPWILDIDDNLLDVPPAKDPDGRYAAYAPTLRRLIGSATVVTVSTDAVRSLVEPLARRVEVLPNRISTRLWRGPARSREPDGLVRALYMGSYTHAEDFELVRPALDRVFKRFPNFRLSIIGVTDRKLPRWAERIRIPPEHGSYHRFVPWLRDQARRFDFAIAPLEDTHFNGFKSALKILECGALGLPVIASDRPVYREIGTAAPGVRLVPDGVAPWQEAIEYQIGRERGDGEALRGWVHYNHAMEPSLEQFDNFVASVARGAS